VAPAVFLVSGVELPAKILLIAVKAVSIEALAVESTSLYF